MFRWITMVAIATFFVLGFWLRNAWLENENLKRDKVTLTTQLDEANASISFMQAKQKEAAEIDIRVTKELTDAEKKNDLLRTELAIATRKLRIKANCPATTTGSVGNDSSVELSPAVGQSVLDIRAGIIRDRAKIDYLQNYITKVCLVE